jgi:hypothetical protein
VENLFNQLPEKFSRRNFAGQVLRGMFMRSVLGGIIEEEILLTELNYSEIEFRDHP